MGEGEDEAILSSKRSSISNNERLKIQLKRKEREVKRLRSSVSFQLGVHLTSVVRRPWRLLLLPVSFPLLALRLGLKRRGQRSHVVLTISTKPSIQSSEVLVIDRESEMKERNNCIVLFPTNGVGFGHFTRMYAVARELRKKDSELEIVFFTPMPTLHVLYSDNFPTYHLAGRYKHSNMEPSQWNMLVEEMLNLVFEVHNPKWFMFDGAFPYRGMLNAIKVHPSMEKMWMKRGSLKANKRIPEDSIHTFDHIIHPSEFIEQTIKQNENLHTIPPITLLQSDEMMTRKNARHAIGVSTDAKVVYVQLGAGRINEINSDIRLIIDALLIHEGVEVVVGESMLGQRLSIHLNRVHVIRDYPNSLYFNGFDAAVQAGGYNSFHEMRMMGIPTLFLPNLKTGMDDQLTRCKLAESEGWGIVLLARDKTSIQDKCALLLSKEKSMQITENSGASAVAELILKGFN